MPSASAQVEVATDVAFSPESYGRFWPARFWLAMHLAGGSIALLVGPFQFLRGLRTARPQVHRWTGGLYLAGIALAVVLGWKRYEWSRRVRMLHAATAGASVVFVLLAAWLGFM